jgi:hypothetical protein
MRCYLLSNTWQAAVAIGVTAALQNIINTFWKESKTLTLATH